MAKIRKGDTVRVIAGDDRGKEGEVLQVDPARRRMIVKGVSIITKHQRPTLRQREGGIIEREGTIHSSNVMLICPECDQPTRVGFTVQEGEKLRRCRRCGAVFP